MADVAIEVPRTTSAHVQNGNANGLAADVSAKSAVECGAARKSVIVDTKADAKSLNESFEEGEASDDGEIDAEGDIPDMEEGELKEEGELDDEDGGDQQGKSSVCKYFFKGQCTWGSHCRFIHPGSVDKGSYNMFESDQPKPAVPEQSHGGPSTKQASGVGGGGGTLTVQQPQSRMQMQHQRGRSPQLIPPVMPLRLPLPIPVVPPMGEFFPPIPEPPRRETMWERGLRTAKHLAKAAARKRDAIEDKMHGLSEKFDSDYEDKSFPEADFAFAEQARNFAAFAMRPNLEMMQRNDRRMMNNNNHNNNNNNMNNNNFNRFERRRSPLHDRLQNFVERERGLERERDRPVANVRQRAADEWQDPWMRSRSPGRNRNQQRWNQNRRSKSESSKSRSRSKSRSGSPSEKNSPASRSASREKTSKRRSGSGHRRDGNTQRSPSGSPISSSRSSSSKSSSSPQKSPRDKQSKQKFSPASRSSPESVVADRRSGSRRSRSAQLSKPPKKRVSEEKPASPSLSSVSSGNGEGEGNKNAENDEDDENDGPRTPPPDQDMEAEEEESIPDVEKVLPSPEDATSSNGQYTQSRFRPAVVKRSPSLISDEDQDEEEDEGGKRRGTDSPQEMSQPFRKKLKKAHKPVKMTMNLKTERRLASAAFNPGDDDNEEENTSRPDLITKSPKVAESGGGHSDVDRSSPLSDEERSQVVHSHKVKHTPPSSPPEEDKVSADKQNKREELLRQLRAVEEAIARKKATKGNE